MLVGQREGMDLLAIETVGLGKRFGAHAAVDGLNLAVPGGSVFGFLGPNGAGKTTTIRMLLGMIRPTQGTATVLGMDVRSQRAGFATRVGAIIENPAFYLQHTALQNLRILALASGFSPAPAFLEGLLERVGLKGCGAQRVGTFSLGMKQRLGLGAALLSNPDLVFLDEPTNGLDPAGMVEMRATLKALADEGKTIFVSSHLLAEVEVMCTHLCIVQKGVQKLSGRTQDLVKDSGGHRLKVDPVQRAVETLAAFPGLHARAQGTDALLVDTATGDVADVVAALCAAGIRVRGVEPVRATLEDLFLELTA
jgi:ABC-2 type transport system ATP-binding protein